MRVTRRALPLILLLILFNMTSIAPARSAAGSVNPTSFQCGFNPSGYFYPQSQLPELFGDFDHLTLWETPGSRSREQEPGVIAGGQVYSFTKVNRIGPFEFTTTDINGGSFSFTGSFHEVCMIEEEARKRPNEVVLEGKLAKLKDGKKIGEVNVQFVYSATLRNSKPDVNTRYPSGRTELWYATREGNTATMRTLLGRGANPDFADAGSGETPLMVAIKSLEAKKAQTPVELLLAARANVNLSDRIGMTALMHAGFAFDDKDGALVSKLIAAHANVNAVDVYGTTVLMHIIGGATQEPALIKNVRHALEAGADPNVRNTFGQTALSFAQEDKSKPIIELLKAAGARP